MALETTKVTAKVVKGLQVDAKARDHVIRLDEPTNLGGDDTGMNPVEALLSSLGGCKLIVVQSFARMHKMNIQSASIELEGELDTDGFTGKNPDAKIGFSKIKTIYHIEAENTPEEIQAYIEFVESRCPVLDTIVNTPEFEVVMG